MVDLTKWKAKTTKERLEWLDKEIESKERKND